MPNNSETGGYLLPSATPAPMEGAALLSFIGDVVTGITGLAADLVRVNYQNEPPVVPQGGTCWCAVMVDSGPGQPFPYIGHHPEALDPANPTVLGYDSLQQHEKLFLNCSFYDQGSTGLAAKYARLLRDGLAIPQNWRAMIANGMQPVSVGEQPITLPSLLKAGWIVRVDLPVTLTRQVDRNYPILNVKAAKIVVNAGDGNTRTIDVTPTSPH